ncbi:MAG TPA: YceI family protein [Rubrivivax sp.]|nr:YceI family protein [Rubrivivax sp.]HPO18677.1 YceI family protein [Rubrivivax sp.]
MVAPPHAVQREPAGFPGNDYRALAARGKPVFRVDPARSIVVIEVRRAGSMARLGHDHVVASHDVAGFVAPGEGRADLWLPLDALVVDEPALRTEAGLTTEPTADDIAGTRRNMLGRVLQTDRHPHVLIGIRELAAGGGSVRSSIRITLHGITRSYEAQASYEKSAEALCVSGTMAIDQSDFGIVPLSVLGGAIAVQDRLEMRYRIQALRMP